MIKSWFRKKTHLCKPYIWWSRLLRKDREEKEKDDVIFLSFCNNYINNALTKLYYVYTEHESLLREAVYKEENALVIITFDNAAQQVTLITKKDDKVTNITKMLSEKFNAIIKNNFDNAFLKYREIEVQKRKAITNEMLQELRWEIGIK